MKYRKKNKAEIILIVLLVLTLSFIWGNSFLGKEASSKESSMVMMILEPVLSVFVGKGNVTEHLVRKLAHFSEFFLLGAEYAALLVGIKRKRTDGFLLTLFFGLFTALVDETIQIFTGRGPQIQDVWLDFSGVVAGAVTVLAVLMIISARKRSAE